jgi:hypothetical protein
VTCHRACKAPLNGRLSVQAVVCSVVLEGLLGKYMGRRGCGVIMELGPFRKTWCARPEYES